MSESH